MSSNADQIRCVKFVRGKTHPVVPVGFRRAETEGRSSEIEHAVRFEKIYPISANSKWRVLSPLRIGPFYIWDRGQHLKVHNFERWWQASKVYSVDVKDGKLSDSFWQRRRDWFALHDGKRRVFPKADNVKTLRAYHDGKFYNYLESRVYYCSTYAWLVETMPAYIELKMALTLGRKLAIYGYDGIPGGEDLVLTPEIMDQCYRDPSTPFGHEQVLACMLLGHRPWLEDIQNLEVLRR